ncbi:hypothetical protein V8E36_005169 [Tilletia maclaganii]
MLTLLASAPTSPSSSSSSRASFAFSSIIAQGDSHRPRVAQLKALDNVAVDPLILMRTRMRKEKVVNSLRRLRNRCMTAEERLRMDGSLLSISDRALLNVALYPVTSREEAKSYFVLTASFNHIIADGKGTFDVVNALLSRADPAPDPSDPTAPSVPSDQAFDVTIEPEADAPAQDEETKAASSWPQSVLKNLLRQTGSEGAKLESCTSPPCASGVRRDTSPTSSTDHRQALKAAMSLWKALKFLPASTGEALVRPTAKGRGRRNRAGSGRLGPHKMGEFVGATRPG